MFPLAEFISKWVSGVSLVANSNEYPGSRVTSSCISKAFAIRPVSVRAVMPAAASLGIIARIFPWELDSLTENLLLSYQS